MTQEQEFYAATVQEAVSKASKAMNTAPGEIEYEVLDEGSTGFLGIGARDARIVVHGSAFSADDSDDTLDEIGISSDEVAIDAQDEPASVEEAESTTLAEAAPEDLLLTVDEIVTELISLMGIDGTVDAHDTDEAILVEVASAQTGLFIGQKGETIDAIQYLLNVMVYRDRPFVKRIVVDTEGYRKRRVEAIQGMAHRIARRAQRERRPLSLPPMSAAERRVVHMFLKENPGVSTSSEGQDEDRRVIVAPT